MYTGESLHSHWGQAKAIKTRVLSQIAVKASHRTIWVLCLLTSAEERILVEEEHRDFSDSLAVIESMKELAGLWSELKRIQQAMYAIATKIQQSNDILYPCKFCKHLWK
ncbi:hypothetical protein ACFLXT_04095 [Chloroflexota bacterium]